VGERRLRGRRAAGSAHPAVGPRPGPRHPAARNPRLPAKGPHGPQADSRPAGASAGGPRPRPAAGPAWSEEFGDLVFTGRTGRPLDEKAIRRAFQAALRAAGLPPVRPHDLRHTTASLLLARGVNVKVVQELLGHATVRVTLETYSHVLPGQSEEALRPG